MEDLQRVYKVEKRIDRIDKIFSECDRFNRKYWCDARAEAVAFLDGLYTAADIVFKEIHK